MRKLPLHIWYFHPYGGGPGLGLYDRPYRLARAWRDQGHSATVFVARFHHLLEQDAAPEPEFLLDGVRYVAVPARRYLGNGPARLLNIWDYTRNLYAAGRRPGRDLPPPDAVIASSPHPFSIFPAHRLASRHEARLVFEIRDIWPLSITEILGVSRLHPFVQMCAAAERFALARSDLVASVLPRADRYLAERGHGGKPFVWVPNGFGAAGPGRPKAFLSEAGRAARARLDAWRAEGRVNIVYTGSIGRPNALDLLLRALVHAKAAGEEGRCGVLIAGKGEELESLRAFASANGLSNVHFAGPLPRREALALLDGADIGYAGLRNVEKLFRYGISPNKIVDYFNASLPVFLPIEPCGDPVSESGGGIARRADEPEAVWRGLAELLAMSPQQRRELGEKGRAYIAREHDYAGIARRYVEAIDSCRLGRSAGRSAHAVSPSGS